MKLLIARLNVEFMTSFYHLNNSLRNGNILWKFQNMHDFLHNESILNLLIYVPLEVLFWVDPGIGLGVRNHNWSLKELTTDLFANFSSQFSLILYKWPMSTFQIFSVASKHVWQNPYDTKADEIRLYCSCQPISKKQWGNLVNFHLSSL
jgi:hypothetical protein